MFADLGLDNADELLARAKLAGQICSIISELKLTQSKAAGVLGVDQPKVSALMRGHLSGFSTERLIRFLNSLGRDVDIVIHRAPRRRRGAGGVRVLAAG